MTHNIFKSPHCLSKKGKFRKLQITEYLKQLCFYPGIENLIALYSTSNQNAESTTPIHKDIQSAESDQITKEKIQRKKKEKNPCYR